MTNAQILAACRSNWEYRGIDDASMRDMLDELSAHLEDAEAAGRTAQDVIGGDVRTFAAAWARARTPLPRRVLRATAVGLYYAGCVLLAPYLFRWTTQLDVTPGTMAFWLVLATVTVAWELRRGMIGLRRSWAVALGAALPAGLLAAWSAGDAPLFTLPLWAPPLLLLPGLPYAVADLRARRRSTA
ncbi:MULTISPECIES: hypothetical protein [Streptomyces]|uniref:Integral membrane protein n=1 Tax=Streptomyces amritsarensis TaxID=681158 RepID=A0ABX3G8E0_9ACTN|nr:MULTISPECIES: hypothetical protein [Streptomyces]AQT74219.1 hypothetical protein B1K54_23515 [Streptomyces sp. fd1-xmd]MDX6760574.1 hypothetical protein [Streptomyces sp. F8]OLZ71846.1 hypothetical protein AVW11_04970 [Streptomyces amritsarensis]